jgi:hypothetical protein
MGNHDTMDAKLQDLKQRLPFGWWVETQGDKPDDTANQFVRDPKFIDTLRSHGLTVTVTALYAHAERARLPEGCIPIHRTLLEKLATDMDSIDMPKIAAAIRRWIANYLLADAPPQPDADDERQLLRDALAALVGSGDVDELRGMELAMRELPAPAEDKAVTINAIHALIATAPAADKEVRHG